ncbi:MAG: winged helix-turn-helix domain-containing protein [Paracoccaceae bacterium]|nr:winged helix-turn-helix domain-containing protein [Paracoccaceae bacterium]
MVEDDAIILSTLCELLVSSDEFYLTKAMTFKEVDLLLQDKNYDLMILNPRLLKNRVKNYLDTINLTGFSGPIIFTGAVNDISAVEIKDIERLFVCIQRPFKIVSLLECIRHLLSKYEFSSEVIINLGDIQFYPGSKLIILENGQKVGLTEKETNILKFLYRSKDHLVSKEVLLNEVWSHTTNLTTHTLETYIYRLRKKIGANLSNQNIIVTKKGGYQLLV